MVEKIKELEAISRLLEPGAEERKRVREKVLSYTEHFLDHVNSMKAYNVTEEKGSGLLKSPFSEDPGSIDEALTLVRDHVDYPGLNPASGGHLGYIPGGGIYYSALGDYMADITNRYAGVFFASPGAVRMENMIIRWTAGLMGYPASAAGNLTSGGSIANLMAVVTARDAMKIKAKDLERSVIYVTKQVHHSVDKALRIAGLGECVKQYVPLDPAFRMDAAALEAQVQTDKKNGLNPFLIIASAGTTDVGAIDPLDQIADTASKHNLWFHVDAAYGGFFILTEEGKKKMKGIERSDSLVADPHKTLFLPYGLGLLLVKDPSKLRDSHYYLASYMQDTLTSNEEMSPADLSPELTKHFRGLRLWLPLKLHGIRPFRAALEEKMLLAKYFHREVQKLGFETGPEPELSVATYRYIPEKGDANDFNEKLVKAVQADGRVFISSTMINGKFTLRLALAAFRTHLDIINLLLKVLNENVEKLEKENLR